MKKKFLSIPVVLWGVVFCAMLLLLRYTLVHKGYFGIFLATPDYFSRVFSNPWPISHVIGDFVTQFFDIAFVGPAVIATAALLVYLLLVTVFRRLLPGKKPGRAVAAVLILAAIIPSTLPSARLAERHARVEICAYMGQWDNVLEVATPSNCRKDAFLRPYAALALAQKGRLAACLHQWPFDGPQDLDMQGVVSREGYFFSSLLYDALECPAEAMHCAFQAATAMPAGISVISLFQYSRYAIEMGDAALVRKYAAVLSKCPRHTSTAASLRQLYGNPDAAADASLPAWEPMTAITNNPAYNVSILYTSGRKTEVAVQYFQAYAALGAE